MYYPSVWCRYTYGQMISQRQKMGWVPPSDVIVCTAFLHMLLDWCVVEAETILSAADRLAVHDVMHGAAGALGTNN